MNVWCGIGRLVADPESRQTTTGKTVTSFKIAVNRGYKGEQQADFIPVVAWEKTAEFVQNYFRKGQQVGVNGKLQTRTYKDNEGKSHFIMEVRAVEVYFADSKRESAENIPNITISDADDSDELPF